MRKKELIYYGLICSLALSCGFPGGLISYDKQMTESIQYSTKVIVEESKCLCIDYRFNFQCDKIKRTTIDTLSGLVLEVYKARGSDFSMRDGRQRNLTQTVLLDSGFVLLKTKRHYQTYGRGGRERFFKEVDYRIPGKKMKTIRRGTKRRGTRVERIVKR